MVIAYELTRSQNIIQTMIIATKSTIKPKSIPLRQLVAPNKYPIIRLLLIYYKTTLVSTTWLIAHSHHHSASWRLGTDLTFMAITQRPSKACREVIGLARLPQAWVPPPFPCRSLVTSMSWAVPATELHQHVLSSVPATSPSKHPLHLPLNPSKPYSSSKCLWPPNK